MLKGKLLSFMFGLIFLSILTPYAIVAIAIAFMSALVVAAYFGIEFLFRKLIAKEFYCPIMRKNVRLELSPGIFKNRPYQDVVTCSAFKGKVRCQKKCLDLPELQYNASTENGHIG